MPDGFPGRFRNPEDRNPLSDPVGLREPGVRRRAVLAEVGAAVLAGCSRSAHRPVACHGPVVAYVCENAQRLLGTGYGPPQEAACLASVAR